MTGINTSVMMRLGRSVWATVNAVGNGGLLKLKGTAGSTNTDANLDDNEEEAVLRVTGPVIPTTPSSSAGGGRRPGPTNWYSGWGRPPKNSRSR